MNCSPLIFRIFSAALAIALLSACNAEAVDVEDEQRRQAIEEEVADIETSAQRTVDEAAAELDDAESRIDERNSEAAPQGQ